MKTLSFPKSLKGLRGFLGLTSYNHKFMKDYGKIFTLIITLLKKDSFKWAPITKKSFCKLKETICAIVVLALPDFSKIFIIKSDALRVGIGAILMQEGRPLDFTSKVLLSHNMSKSMY